MRKHTTNWHSPSRRGRPQKPETTELIAALIVKQLAMSRRTATKINAILETHARRVDVVRVWVRHVDVARVRLSGQLPEQIRGRLKWSDDDMAVIQTLIDEALEELVVTDEDRALAALPPLPEEPRAVVEPVMNLASARAQTARLQSRLIDLRQRIAPPAFRRD